MTAGSEVCVAVTGSYGGDFYECDRPVKAYVNYTPSLHRGSIPMCGVCIGALKRRRHPQVTISSEQPLEDERSN